ncbi:uncharacterized protein LOC135962846 [Calliphora vicina]|uniref:uncharacterized protein LOC135962846 n=1 Tax=Calliphora vicina TaxID=7373 RepID=UPI00325A9DAE
MRFPTPPATIELLKNIYLIESGGVLGKPKSSECAKTASSKKGCKSKSSEVPLNFNPSTSKAALARTDRGSVKTPVLGAASLKTQAAANPVPIVSKGAANKISGTQATPLPASKGTANKFSGSQAVPPAQQGDNNPTRHVTPARRAFLRRRAAEKIIDRLGNKPAESLSTDDLSSLNWARNIIADLQNPPHASKDAPKRQRSEEEAQSQSQQPATKRPKSHRSFDKSFSEVAKGHLVRAVIDRSDSDCSISHANWDMVRRKLMGVFWRVLKENPGPPPQCDDAGWYRGRVKLMACSNERSAMLFKQAVALLDGLWEGARLDVVSVDEIPRRPRSTARVPDEPAKPEEILELLRIGNPDIPTHDWMVARVSESEGGYRRITVIMNQESLAPLRKNLGKVYYGFESIFLRVYRGDDKGKLVQDDIEPTPDDMSCDETTSSVAQEDTHSNSEMVGEFFGPLDDVVDEDALLDSSPSDQEDVNVTIIQKHGDGEGNPN